MYQKLGTVVLKSGEEVEAGVVIGPDKDWQGRIEHLLAHKDDLWRWQISQLLSNHCGIEGRFHILHRDGIPFSQIMTTEYQGVGLFGHVWTIPADRGGGAASQLMQLQMESFRTRGGRALYLGTGYDSTAYRIYSRHGFQSIEPYSGVMAYFATSESEFEADYFAPGTTEIETLNWVHWATAAALLSNASGGVLRLHSMGAQGRHLSEGSLLGPLREEMTADSATPTRVAILQKTGNEAVVGIAAWGWDAAWPGVCVVDVYCHPNFWDRAGELLASLQLPPAHRITAYADTHDDARRAALAAAGFREIATLPGWLAADAAKSGWLDVVVFEKSP